MLTLSFSYPFQKGPFSISLCLTPDDVTCQCEKSRGRERVKVTNMMTLVISKCFKQHTCILKLSSKRVYKPQTCAGCVGDVLCENTPKGTFRFVAVSTGKGSIDRQVMKDRNSKVIRIIEK